MKRSHLRLLRFLLGQNRGRRPMHEHTSAHTENLIYARLYLPRRWGAGEPAEVHARAEWLDTDCCANVAWITEELEEN